MNLFQMTLTIGALMIFSMISLNFNSAILRNSTVDIENKVMLSAISLSDDMIEEIKSKHFDETTIPFMTTNPQTLTKPTILGPESGEAYPNFDDIDDFNNFTKIVTEPHAENYNVNVRVRYVDKNNQDQILSTQSFYKRVTVTVTSPFMRTPISHSFIFTLK